MKREKRERERKGKESDVFLNIMGVLRYLGYFRDIQIFFKKLWCKKQHPNNYTHYNDFITILLQDQHKLCGLQVIYENHWDLLLFSFCPIFI